MTFTDVISTVGVSIILLAFFLSSFNFISNKSKGYFILNAVGGIFACYGSYLLNSVPFVVLEGTWSVLAIIGLIKNLKQ